MDTIDMKGVLDLENATLRGSGITVSKDLVETFLVDVNHPEKNTFLLVSN